MQDGALISTGARTQSDIAQSSCEARYIAAAAATSEAKYIQALFVACGQQVHIHLHSDSKQKNSATPSSSGSPLPVVASRSWCQTCSNQQGTGTWECCRLKHQTWRQTFARVLSYVGGCTDPESVSGSSPVSTFTSFPVSVSLTVTHTRRNRHELHTMSLEVFTVVCVATVVEFTVKPGCDPRFGAHSRAGVPSLYAVSRVLPYR